MRVGRSSQRDGFGYHCLQLTAGSLDEKVCRQGASSLGILLMAAGTLADRYGRKRVFTIGVATFTGFSLALGLASSVWLIDLLRAGQGVGAAAALAGGSAALAQEFDGHARTRAFSLLGTTLGDWQGAFSFTAVLTVFTVAMIESPAIGWASPAMLALIAAFVSLLTAFAVIELRTAPPMFDLSLFCYRRFIGVQLLPIATCACFVVLLVILPLRFIGIEGLSEIKAGFLMLALSAPMLVVPLIAATLARRITPGMISGFGLLVVAAGLAWLGTMEVGDDRSVIAPMLLVGIGSGLPWGLMDGLSVRVVPKERAGMATGIFDTVRVAGEGIALAIVSAALAALIAAALHRVPDLSGTVLAQGGQRLAVGDAAGATNLSAELDGTTLLHAYQTAFATLSWVLVGITTACAIAVFAPLGRKERLDAIGVSTDADFFAA